MSKRDLFVVVADLDAENAIRTLLGARQDSLGIRVEFNPDGPSQGDMLRYVGRDSGCLRDAVELLRPPQQTHRHAMLIFDRHGCGAEGKDRAEIETEVEQRLQANGWQKGDASVIVIDPELEAWVWSTSPHVADVLGWHDRQDELRPFLTKSGWWNDGEAKPHDPKEAMSHALRKAQKPLGSGVFAEIASRVGLGRCIDPAFQKLRASLKTWFPA